MPKKGPRLKIKEAPIDRAIGDFFHYQSKIAGFFFYKQNPRGYFNRNIGAFVKDKNPYVRSGNPDYVVIYRGFHSGFEVKAEDGVQSENQIDFERDLKEKGEAPYYLVRSVEDSKKRLEEFISLVNRFYQKAGIEKSLLFQEGNSPEAQ